MSNAGILKKSFDAKMPVYQRIQEIDINKATQVFKKHERDNKGYISYYALKGALEELGISFYYRQN